MNITMISIYIGGILLVLSLLIVIYFLMKSYEAGDAIFFAIPFTFFFAGMILLDYGYDLSTKTANQYLKNYIESIQTATYESIISITNQPVGDNLILDISLLTINSTQEEITITVSNNSDSGRLPYQATQTVIKMR